MALDRLVEAAAAETASRLTLGSNGWFLESWLDDALVLALRARLGETGVAATGARGAAIPNWSPSPKSCDVSVWHPGESLRAAIECKIDTVEETLWDVYKGVAYRSLEHVEAAYCVVVARQETWGGLRECVALFAGQNGVPRDLRSAELFSDWRGSWAYLLQGGSARPTRVPARIRVTRLCDAPIASAPDWRIRAVRFDPIPDGGWLRFDGGWPIGLHPEPALSVVAGAS